MFFSSEGWREDPGWETAARGEIPLQQPQLWTAPGGSLESYHGTDDEVEDVEEKDTDPVKRYLLMSALDDILLRRQPINLTH